MVAVFTLDELIGFRIADDLLFHGIELKRATDSGGDITQMTQGRREMSDQGVGVQLAALANRRDEIPDVGFVILRLWLHVQRHRLVLRIENLNLTASAQEHLSAGRDTYAYFKHEETPQGAVYAVDVLKQSRASA